MIEHAVVIVGGDPTWVVSQRSLRAHPRAGHGIRNTLMLRLELRRFHTDPNKRSTL